MPHLTSGSVRSIWQGGRETPGPNTLLCGPPPMSPTSCFPHTNMDSLFSLNCQYQGPGANSSHSLLHALSLLGRHLPQTLDFTTATPLSLYPLPIPAHITASPQTLTCHSAHNNLAVILPPLLLSLPIPPISTPPARPTFPTQHHHHADHYSSMSVLMMPKPPTVSQQETPFSVLRPAFLFPLIPLPPCPEGSPS